MRYFIPASERQGSCYFEFQPGRWRGRFWLPGSILLADERWEALRLTELFGGVLPEFDYFGVTPVSRGSGSASQRAAGTRQTGGRHRRGRAVGRGQLCAARRHQHSGPVNGGAAVKYIGIALLIAAGFVLLTLGLAILLFRLAFGARKTTEKEMFVLPDTDQYRPYAAEARRMIRAALALPYEPVTIRSDDGLTLFGRCYPAARTRRGSCCFTATAARRSAISAAGCRLHGDGLQCPARSTSAPTGKAAGAASRSVSASGMTAAAGSIM